MNDFTSPASQNEIKTTTEHAGAIQQHLQQLEILAHHARMSMDEMLALLQRQFVVANQVRCKGNVARVAAELKVPPSRVYQLIHSLRIAGRKNGAGRRVVA
jgi:DNA-binding NtrC family response regulator